MPGAGELNKLVVVERVVETSDGAGGKSRDWQVLTRVWAKATPIGGGERLIAGTLRTKQGWRIEIRRRGDITITNRDRLRLPNGEVVNIGSIEDPDGSNRFLVALGETGNAN